jgi:chromate transporter
MNPPGTVKPPLATALRYWLKLGCISFGGPAGQIAMMHQDLVEHRHWISEARFNHALRFCMTLPGPEAQQLATYIGWSLHGVRGGVAAGLLFILPSFALLLAISWAYAAFGHSAWLRTLFDGLKPAILALVVLATWRMGSRTLKSPMHGFLAFAAFLAVTLWQTAFPWVLISAALAGSIWNRLRPEPTSFETEAVDQDLPFSHKPDWRPTFRVWLHGAWLWGLPFLILILWGGWRHLYTQMAWFFTKAAWLTFGGAYAVLPYVFQASVHHYHWITPTQMMDGLALGESTPGPLIMVLTFVAFLGGYQNPSSLGNLGVTYPAWAGAAAMLVATWFTFLPSFLLILSGAPWIDAMRRLQRLQNPLTAMTAAIVGVMAHLGLQLGIYVLWPEFAVTGTGTPPWGIPTGRSLDWLAVGLTLLALAGLARLRWPIPVVLALSAALGMLGRTALP